MVGMVRFEKENWERACPAIWGSCPALQSFQKSWISISPSAASSKNFAGTQQRVPLFLILDSGQHCYMGSNPLQMFGHAKASLPAEPEALGAAAQCAVHMVLCSSREWR